MMIYKNSKKGGFAVGSNKISSEALKAGGFTAIIGVLMAIALGAFTPKGKKKKSTVAVAALMPTVFKFIKAHVQNEKILELAESFSQSESDSGIEVIYAEPIASEEEIYEHIG